MKTFLRDVQFFFFSPPPASGVLLCLEFFQTCKSASGTLPHQCLTIDVVNSLGTCENNKTNKPTNEIQSPCLPRAASPRVPSHGTGDVEDRRLPAPRLHHQTLRPGRAQGSSQHSGEACARKKRTQFIPMQSLSF